MPRPQKLTRRGTILSCVLVLTHLSQFTCTLMSIQHTIVGLSSSFSIICKKKRLICIELEGMVNKFFGTSWLCLAVLGTNSLTAPAHAQDTLINQNISWGTERQADKYRSDRSPIARRSMSLPATYGSGTIVRLYRMANDNVEHLYAKVGWHAVLK
jgi:hypothetical protein